jgi:hypothetical protein
MEGIVCRLFKPTLKFNVLFITMIVLNLFCEMDGDEKEQTSESNQI